MWLIVKKLHRAGPPWNMDVEILSIMCLNKHRSMMRFPGEGGFRLLRKACTDTNWVSTLAFLPSNSAPGAKVSIQLHRK